VRFLILVFAIEFLTTPMPSESPIALASRT